MFQRAPLHTYVKSSCGASWGCWGGQTGGTSVCSGTASSIQADCIDGADNAGILYYITGVCHQTANRILWPAGIILPDAAHPDIRSSYFLYDEWGKNIPGWPQWPDRANICTGSPSSSGPSSRAGSSSYPPFSGSSSMSFGFRRGGGRDRHSDMAQLVKAGLGHSVDPRACDELLKLQTELQARQEELARLLLANEINKEKYIFELNEAMKFASTVGERILGPEAFHKVFGEFRVQNLGDVTRFLSGNSAAG